jgi:hypothetical protein
MANGIMNSINRAIVEQVLQISMVGFHGKIKTLRSPLGASRSLGKSRKREIEFHKMFPLLARVRGLDKYIDLLAREYGLRNRAEGIDNFQDPGVNPFPHGACQGSFGNQQRLDADEG